MYRPGNIWKRRDFDPDLEGYSALSSERQPHSQPAQLWAHKLAHSRSLGLKALHTQLFGLCLWVPPPR